MFLLNYLEHLLMVMFLLGIFFVGSIQPMIMVSSLIMITLMYSYTIYNVMSGYWFSYILIMVMLSGVLVVFTYMVSLMPNEKFESYNLMILFIFMMMLLVGLKYLYMDNMSYMCLVLWVSYISTYNLFMISFLFSVMLMVVWLSCVDSGAINVGY